MPGNPIRGRFKRISLAKRLSQTASQLTNPGVIPFFRSFQISSAVVTALVLFRALTRKIFRRRKRGGFGAIEEDLEVGDINDAILNSRG